MISKKKITKKTNKPKLKPLVEGEVFNLPCGATVEVIGCLKINYDKAWSPKERQRSLINLKLRSENGLAREGNISVKEINLGFYGSNIPLLIEILQRAYLVK